MLYIIIDSENTITKLYLRTNLLENGECGRKREGRDRSEMR